jgi:two-component system sensor histidine kinase KdpD
VTDRRDPPQRATRSDAFARYAYALGACAITSVAAVVMLPWLDLANIVMLFLLTVVLAAWRLGRGPAVLTALVSVVAFDYFCVPPRLTLAVSDAQYLVTFAVMLAVGLITGQLTAGMRSEARVAAEREARARALYGLARDLSTLLDADAVVRTAVDEIARALDTRIVILLPDEQGHLAIASPAERAPDIDLISAQRAYDLAESTGARTPHSGADVRGRYVPLRAPVRTRGVMAVEWRGPGVATEQQRHLETLAALTAMALERVHYVDVAQAALVRMESERLRHALLAALSHDLRTPVAAMSGLAESLELTVPALSAQQRDIARAIADQAGGMGRLIDNLLDMARLASGPVELRREWQSVEEVVGAALRAARPALGGHRVEVALDPALPLVEFDAVLIERVLYNLLENAGKYTPAGSRVEVCGHVAGDVVEICVSDEGPGVPQGEEDTIFEKFVRGSRTSATAGVGLGLAISRAIVHAHGGTIRVHASATGGARFCFTLPLRKAPSVPAEADVVSSADGVESP